MSYRPHKRLKATRLEDKCIELICNNMDEHFGEGKKRMELKLKRRVLEYLRGNPVMISFAEGFFDDEWSDAGVDLSLCELPAGLLDQIGRSIPGLKSINLKQCSGIDMLVPSGFLSLCQGCRHIRTVNLVGATTMSDTMLQGMHKLCGSLRVVLLGGCMNITPAALVDFVRNAGRNLVELDLSGCQVNDFVVKEIVENCSNLVTLSMAYCDDVSHMAWCMLLRTCIHVTNLRLARVSGLSDALVLLIARHLGGSVEELDIAGCKLVTDEAINYVAQRCKKLKRLNVRYCEKVSEACLDNLPDSMQGVIVLRTTGK